VNSFGIEVILRKDQEELVFFSLEERLRTSLKEGGGGEGQSGPHNPSMNSSGTKTIYGEKTPGLRRPQGSREKRRDF